MTIKDLARLSGYSLGTVSRVLNNHPNVSDKARDTIMAIVNEVGFELNTNAKNLKQQRNKLVVAIVKGRANEMFAQLVEEIQRLIAGAEYPLLLHYIDEGEDEVRAARKLCREKKPMGVLFLGGESKNFGADFDGFKVPTVLATNSAVEWGFANLSSVTIDDTAAACCAVSYLIAQGHRIWKAASASLAVTVRRRKSAECATAAADRPLHRIQKRNSAITSRRGFPSRAATKPWNGCFPEGTGIPRRCLPWQTSRPSVQFAVCVITASGCRRMSLLLASTAWRLVGTTTPS